MGLDLQGAFDNVNHSAILSQVLKLDMGKRTHEYIRSFFTGRTAEIVAGDLAAEVGENRSRGTPQGSVILPILPLQPSHERGRQ